MSSATDAAGFKRELEELREDFVVLRRNESPIKAMLEHYATNAEAMGVEGWPGSSQGNPRATHGAGNRNGGIREDERGRPLFLTDGPTAIDVKGKPITNTAGQAYDVIMPAHRSVHFWAADDAPLRLQSTAERGGALLSRMGSNLAFDGLRDWSFTDAGSFWWAFLFELSCSGRHPTFRAMRQLWVSQPDLLCHVPYDLGELRRRCESRFLAGRIPEEWLERLPDAYFIEIDNIASACVSTAEHLMDASRVADDEDEYQSGQWFKQETKIPPSRLRKAANSNRETKRVRKRTIDGVECYLVADARRWWPNDMTKA